MSEDDVALMLAFQRGDYNAFAALFERHQKALLQYFHAQAGDLHVAEDCAQEVWKRIFRARHDYEPRAQFKTFLYRIARNLWIDWYRARSKHGREVSLDGDPASGEGGLGRILAAEGPAPEEEMSNSELRERIEDALARLPTSQREVFVLAEFQSLRYAEISATLGIPVGTVKSRMFNAIRRLREILQRDYANGHEDAGTERALREN